MTEPRTDHKRTAEWCPDCWTWEHDADQWAERHHDETGHTTHRRTTLVETWEATP